jgi:hypothetical protein
MASHEWWVFENLARVEQFPTRFRRISREIQRELRRCNCTNAVVTPDGEAAFCPSCGISAKTDRSRSALCTRLWETVNQALVAYDHVLSRIFEDVIDAAQALANSTNEASLLDTANSVGEKLKHGVSVADFTEEELRVLILAMRRMKVSPDAGSGIEESISPVITGEEIVEDAVVVH